MDANNTRFHLLQGAADWRRRWRTPDPAGSDVPMLAKDSEQQVSFIDASQEITLWRQEFRFPASPADRPVSDGDRRGAARDAFGNWYWIAPDRGAILVRSSGTQAVSVFWPVSESAPAPQPGSFAPQAASSPGARTLQGLAVTEDHYLVAGTLDAGGLLVFDLYSVGAPRERVWPVPFTPWDMAPRPGGGLVILDREHACVWALDRRFDVDSCVGSVAVPARGNFAHDDPALPDGPRPLALRLPLTAQQAWPLPGVTDPLAIDVMTDGCVLVLDRRGADGFPAVRRLRAGVPVGAPVSTAPLASHIPPGTGPSPFTLVAHDFAFAAREEADPAEWAGRLYVVGTDGNQAYGFGLELHDDALVLSPVMSFYPMRLFGGRALVRAEGSAWYDCGDRFVRLTGQCRPRHASSGELWTPLLDGGEPGCVWHRLRLDAVLPPGTSIEVWSRAADDWRELMRLAALDPAERALLGAPLTGDDPAALAGMVLLPWQPEPAPVKRGDGSELPFVATPATRDAGTYELLFQQAVGRFLQLRLVLRGDGRSTPRLRALRAWYPRFSYLQHYLPAVYREDAMSASFLDRWLANFEGLFTTMEDRVAAAEMLFDVDSAPAATLDWLGRWFGLALDPSWDEARRRLLLRNALRFFAMRGTVRGLQAALRLALEDCVDAQVFADPGANARLAAPVRLIERFRTRRTPGQLLGDVGTAVATIPHTIDPSRTWQPAMGRAELNRRYAQALAQPAGAVFPLVPSGAPAGWADFAGRELGFVPSSAGTETAAWLAFQQRTRGSVGWPDLPADAPTMEQHAASWSRFLAEVASADRGRWQAFLARRYRAIATLNAAWHTRWAAFGDIALPGRLPADGEPLADWYVFEGTVLAMHEHAHRFTVMLPVPKRLRSNARAQQAQLALARRVIDLEKPAHTVYDLRFYWAMFRVGEARLGDDTLIDYGSRSPELMAPMVLGTGALAESYLAAPAGRDAPGRLQVGRERVGGSTRVGGP